MANVTEGLSTPAPEENVNSAAGFEAALAKKGVTLQEGEESSKDTSIAAGLEVIEPGQARDTSGKFAPSAAADTSTDGEAPAVAPVAETDDPEIAAYLAKYDGDPVKALRAATEAQKLIGRRDEEKDTLRETVAELKGRLDAFMSTAAAPAPQPVLSADEVDERADTLIQTRGYADAATAAANDFLASGDKRTYQAVINAWSLEDAFSASEHVADFKAWQRDEAARAAAPTGDPDGWVEEQKAVGRMTETIRVIATDMGDEKWAQVAPKMDAAIQSLPAEVQNLTVSEDENIRLAGFKIVADRATILAGLTPATGAPAPATPLPPSAERKLGAQVATGSLRPVASGAKNDEPQTVEEATKAFKRELLATETTNVAAGLTFGKPAPGMSA